MPLSSAWRHQACRSATSCSADTLVRVQSWRSSSRLATSVVSAAELAAAAGAWGVRVHEAADSLDAVRVAAAVKTPTVQPNWESLAGAMAADFIARFTFATEVAR